MLWRTPSMVTATRIWNAPQVLSGMLGADVTTAKEVHELADALPFKRLYGLQPSLTGWPRPTRRPTLRRRTGTDEVTYRLLKGAFFLSKSNNLDVNGYLLKFL